MYASLKQEFMNPPSEFSPIPFWFWNDSLSEIEITRQIEDFHEKGVMGFVIHPRKGLPEEIPYLSDKFLHYVRYAVKEADRLNMHVVLYDEAMYPSGSAHGMVVKEHPEYATRALRIQELPADQSISFDTLNHVIHSQLDAQEQLLAIVAGKKNDKNELLTETLHALPAFTAPHLQHFAEDDSTLFLLIESYSKGTIRGIHTGEDDGEANAPASADLLNPQAMQAFIRITYDTYYNALKEYFGNTVIAMFTDEPDVLGRNHIPDIWPWTPGFDEYLNAHGVKISQLPLLWYEAADHSHQVVRTHYKKIVNKRLTESYYQQISLWCTGHGISLTGHPAASDDIGLLKYFHIPGQDVVWRWIAPENQLGITGKDSTMGKCSSDCARHSGKRRNSNECFGCCGPNGIQWAFTAGDMKWYLDWLFVRGVNLLYPHAFFYSIKGEERFGERPPDVGPNNTFWPYYRQFATYIHRMCWLMTDSYNTTPIALLCKEDHLPWEPAKDLFCNQLEFNYLEEDLLHSSCSLEMGWIKIQKQAYRILILASTNIDNCLLEKLNAFTAAGGHIIYWDKEENLAATVQSILAEDNFCPKQPAFSALPDKSYTAALTPCCPMKDLRLSHVTKGGCDFYLLVNEGEHCINGIMQLPVNTTAEYVTLELWDAWRSTQETYSFPCCNQFVQLPLHLNRRESKIVYINANTLDLPAQQCPDNSAIDSDWRVAADLSSHSWQLRSKASQQSDSLPLNSAEIPEWSAEITQLTSWTEWPDMEYFSGAVCYETSFLSTSVTGKQVLLDLGSVYEIASVTVNGHFIDTRLWAPYRFDITNAIQQGMNHLSITVTNTPANHIMKEKLPSGLLGPVQLLTR